MAIYVNSEGKVLLSGSGAPMVCSACPCDSVTPVCSFCSTNSDPPAQIQAVVTGFNAFSGSCGATCTSLNGTYTLDFVDDCHWMTTFSPVTCSTSSVFEEIHCAIGQGGSQTQVWFCGAGGTISTLPPPFTRKNAPTPVSSTECDTFSGRVVSSFNATNSVCGDAFSAWQASITAIP